MTNRELSNNHRLFTQYMLTNGTVTLANALSIIEKISSAENSINHLRTLLMEINREIGNQGFKIVMSTCEISGDEMVVWVNTKNDNISKEQRGFSAIQCEYFNAIMQEIIASDEHRIVYPRCINISSTLTASFTRENGEKALQQWIHGGYFVKIKQYVYLGIRLIMEFTMYLKSQTENCICGLCEELAFIGMTCDHCDKTFHSHCMKRYLQNRQTCPSCKSEWTQTEHSSKDNQSMDTDEEDDDDDDSTPSMPKRRR